MVKTSYVHGYSDREAIRLNDQSATLENIIHNDSVFPEGSLILEAGCGVGAQTRIMAQKNPHSDYISVDISEESLDEARETIKSLNINNVEFRKADILCLPFSNETFDIIIICFVLEHLNNPLLALKELMRVLKTGGTMVTIEGDHGSTFFYPDSEYAYKAIDCQIMIQKQNGGNSNIGRELYPLLRTVGLRDISVTPRVVYADASRPHLVEGFIKNTFAAMIDGIRQTALDMKLIERSDFDRGIADLYRTAEPDGVFVYTFFKAFGIK
jgi:SAM-dependent methyltransferase